MAVRSIFGQSHETGLLHNTSYGIFDELSKKVYNPIAESRGSGLKVENTVAIYYVVKKPLF